MKLRRLAACVVVAAVLAGCAGAPPKPLHPDIGEDQVSAEERHQRELALEAMLVREARLVRLYYALLEAAAPLCGNNMKPLVGLSVSVQSDWGEEWRDAAKARTGVSDRPTVDRFLPGAAAERDGVRIGDVVVAVNGKKVKPGRRAADYVRKFITKGLEKGDPIVLDLERNGAPLSVSIAPRTICAIPVYLIEDDYVNAFSGRDGLIVTTGMMRFAADDRELSMVLGHELAHSLLRHWKLPAGSDKEAEADYLGLYLMELAGIPLDGTAEFWRRMGAANPASISVKRATTHPGTPERYLAIEATQREIAARKAAGKFVLPDIREIPMLAGAYFRPLVRVAPLDEAPAENP